jgi:hypothetical protein
MCDMQVLRRIALVCRIGVSSILLRNLELSESKHLIDSGPGDLIASTE